MPSGISRRASVVAAAARIGGSGLWEFHAWPSRSFQERKDHFPPQPSTPQFSMAGSATANRLPTAECALDNRVSPRLNHLWIDTAHAIAMNSSWLGTQNGLP